MSVSGDKSEIASRNVAPAGAHRVGWRFIAIYAAAYTGMWMALLSPVLVGLALCVRAIDPDHATENLSLVMGVGALMALFGNPFFGHLSDRTTSRFGMRRPWLIGGAVGGAVGLAVIAQAGSIAQVLLGWCIAQLAYNALLAALVAILPDQVPPEQRGTVSGVVGISLPLGMIGGTYLVQAVAGSMLAVFLLPAAIAIAGAICLAWTLPDRRLAPVRRPRYGLDEFLGSFWINPVRFPDFAWTWASRFLLFIGVAVLMTYQGFYLMHQLGYPATDVPRAIFLSTLVQSTALVISSVLGGRLSDVVGRRKIFVFGAALVYALGLSVIAFAASQAQFLAGMAIAGAGQGMHLAVGLALVTDVLPDRESDAARNLGVFNIANAMPQSLAPAIAPMILALGDGSYTILFIVAACFVFLGALAIGRVRGVR